MNSNYIIPGGVAIGLTMTACTLSAGVTGDWTASEFGDNTNLPAEESTTDSSGTYTTTTYLAIDMSIGVDDSVTLDVIYTASITYNGEAYGSEDYGGTYTGTMTPVDGNYEISLSGDNTDVILDCQLTDTDELDCDIVDPSDNSSQGTAIFVRAGIKS